jgi:hypothetical protein
MVYKPVLGMKNILVTGVLKKVLARNGVTGVVLKGFDLHGWGISTSFVK